MGLLTGRTALITGAARGIGKAIAMKFASEGANIAFTDLFIDEEHGGLATEREIAALGVKCKGYASNAADFAQTESVVAKVKEEFGSVDILVNNAGVSRDSLLLDKNIKEFQRILDVNLIGTYLCSKYVGKVMLNAKKGKIINVASSNAIDTYYPESCDYDASKAGVISLTHNLAREFAPFISVNCVCPGWTKTDMNKDLSIEQIVEEKKKILLGRFAEPEEISKVIVFLASSKASYINDSIIRVDGGNY